MSGMQIFWFGVQLFFFFAVLLPLGFLCVVFIWTTAPWLFLWIGGGIVYAISRT